MDPSRFHELLMETAKEHGFPLSGAVDLDLTDFSQHIARYDDWLAKGYAGQMEYLKRGRDRRADPRLLLPSTQSVFCVAVPYESAPAGSTDSKIGPRYARYIQGKDYHLVIKDRLEKMTRALSQKVSPLEWKVCVDTSAVLERSWASLVGLGWIGKNTLLIHPRHGSYLFLGVVLLSEKTGQSPKPLPNFCGHCDRCLRSCPTQAFDRPGILDSQKCVSYLTLEKRGSLELGEGERSKLGSWVAGCDICQEVCPFNHKASKNAGEGTLAHDWEYLLKETLEQYRARIKNSALSRVKPAQFSRNLAIALSNAFEKTPELGENLYSTIVEKMEREPAAEAKAEWQRLISQIEARRSKPAPSPPKETSASAFVHFQEASPARDKASHRSP